MSTQPKSRDAEIAEAAQKHADGIVPFLTPEMQASCAPFVQLIVYQKYTAAALEWYRRGLSDCITAIEDEMSKIPNSQSTAWLTANMLKVRLRAMLKGSGR